MGGLVAGDVWTGVRGGGDRHPKAKGICRDDERGGTLVKDEPVVVHCYTTPADTEDDRNLSGASAGRWGSTLGREKSAS
jgi:hypothetical protein